MPLKTNSMMKPTRYSGSDCCCDAISTIDGAERHGDEVDERHPAPPNRSASAPPTGRISEPSSGPRNVR